MEITHFGKFYWPAKGGMETALKDLAEMGVDLGHSVKCVVSDRSVSETRIDHVNSVEVRRCPVRFQALSAPVSYEFFSERLAAGSVMHLHLPHPVAELATAKRRKNFRLIPYFHAYPVNQKQLGAAWYSLFTEPLLRKSESILVSNEYLLKAFPMLRKWEKKVRVVPFQVESWEKSSFESAKTKRDGKITLALGRMVPYKGFDLLIRAWKAACPSSGRELHIVGDGPQLAELRALVQELGLASSVFLPGACSDEEKERLLESASLFAAPSINNSETFGISILEAMARGLPVITSQLDTGVKLLSRGGACGASVMPGSVQSLSDAIRSMQALPSSDLQGIGEANLRFANENFSPEICRARYAEVLR